MKALELIKSLNAAGATINVEGEKLRVRAPKGMLTQERQEMLRAYKPELVKILATHSCLSCGRFSFSKPNALCYWCRKLSGAT